MKENGESEKGPPEPVGAKKEKEKADDPFSRSTKIGRTPSPVGPRGELGEAAEPVLATTTTAAANTNNAFEKIMGLAGKRSSSTTDLGTIGRRRESISNIAAAVAQSCAAMGTPANGNQTIQSPSAVLKTISTTADAQPGAVANGGTPNEKRKSSPGAGANSEPMKKAKTDTVMPRFERKIDELQKLTKEHVTTAKGIKDGIADLRKMFVSVKREYDNKCRELANLTASATKPEAPADTSPIIRDKIIPDMSKSLIEELLELDWPTTAFETTTLNTRDLAGQKANLKTTLVYPDNFEQDANFQKLAAIVPEINSLTTECFNKLGTIEIVRNQTTAIPGLVDATNANTYTIHPAMVSRAGELDVADIMTWAASIKKYATKMQTDLVEIYIPKDASVSKVRKTLECCLAETRIKILLRLNKSQKKEFQLKRTRAREGTNGDAIIIHAKEGSTYSDVVKELKKNVSPGEMGVEIKGINSTLNGHVLIKLSETTPGGKQEMLNKIRDTVTSADKTQISRRTKGIVLLDVEHGISQEELLGTLSTILETEESAITANPFRPMRSGNQMVTIFLPPPLAERAIGLGKIRLGWTVCRVKERADPPFCQKCQIYGHPTHTCLAKSVVKRRCLKCGGEHTTNACNSKSEFCISCNTDGHRANSMRCPKYKALIQHGKQ